MWLTGRSIGLLAVAGVSLLLAVAIGIPALLYVTGLTLGLVVAALVLALLARPRLQAVRTVEPTIVEPDETAEVVIDLTLRASVPVVAGMWRDRLPSTLIGSATGTVPPTNGQESRLRYDVLSRRRGSHEIGPLTIIVSDAFGLVERSLNHDDHSRIVVLPRRRHLAAPVGPGGTADGTTRMRRNSGLGQDDVIARPYLPGDALKRWHWKATAHHGEPMVRQEESELRPTVLVVLDPEPRVHDQASFEWSVSAAASIITHYGERGFDVDLASGASSLSLESGHGLQDALVTLALVEPNSSPGFIPPRECTAFVLTGVLDAAGAARLVGTVPARDTIAFVGRGTADAAHEVLNRAGWHVVVRDASADIAVAWSEAMGTPAR